METTQRDAPNGFWLSMCSMAQAGSSFINVDFMSPVTFSVDKNRHTVGRNDDLG